jgi:hypothetical protein
MVTGTGLHIGPVSPAVDLQGFFMSIANSLRARLTFGLKAVVAALLVVLADILFFADLRGSTVGIFALVWAWLMPLAMPAMRRSKPALISLGLACVMGLILVDDPSLLGSVLFWVALSSAALLARRESTDAIQLLVRLVIHGFLGLYAPARDIARVARLPRSNLRKSLLSLSAVLALPLAGGLVFVSLFAQANPVVAHLLGELAFAFPTGFDGLRVLFWVAAFVAIWPSLRPTGSAVRFHLVSTRDAITLPGVTLVSVTVSLCLFNLLFGVENLLDIVFLWSGAPLPAGVTMAEYAHRGAYPLIVTALLAGAFVLITAQPNSEIGRSPLIRRLVVLWIAQNLVLVMSSVIRTFNYIDVYMLTRLRVAALVWMGLVAVGLILICWRIVAHRSLAWLINAVAASALVVLLGASAVDLGSIAAMWNVRHAREIGGTGQTLDLGYLRELGPSALIALAELETQPLRPDFRERVAFIRQTIQGDMTMTQETPYGWTWRASRRLAAAQSTLDSAPHIAIRKGERAWDGGLVAPSAPVPVSAPFVPLTLPAPQ